MKTWIKRTLIGLFGAALLAVGVGACSHRHARHDLRVLSAEDAAKWRSRVIAKVGKELQLDEAQRQRLGSLFDTLREQRNAVLGQTVSPRAELQSLISGARFDQTRALALVEEKTSTLRSKSPEVIAAMATFYDGLKAEQQGRLREWLQRTGRHRLGGPS